MRYILTLLLITIALASLRWLFPVSNKLPKPLIFYWPKPTHFELTDTILLCALNKSKHNFLCFYNTVQRSLETVISVFERFSEKLESQLSNSSPCSVIKKRLLLILLYPYLLQSIRPDNLLRHQVNISNIKKLLITISVILLITATSSAQTNTFPVTGNAGIGTTGPVVPLEIKAPGVAINGSTDLVALFRNSSLSSSNSSGEVKIGLGFSNHYAAAISAAKEAANYTGLRFYTELGSNTTKLAMSISANGNVGIGTTSPQSTLDINGAISTGLGPVNGNTTKLFLRNNAGKTWALSSGVNGITENNFSIYNWSDNTTTSYFNITPTGNVGIGTTSPQANMHIVAATNQNATPLLKMAASDNHALLFSPSFAAYSYNSIVQAGDQGIIFTAGSVGTGGFAIAPWAVANSGLRIDSDGDVSIGTSDSKNYKLAVNGSAVFTKAVVKLNANWPDYIFDPDYKLPTIQSIENYLKKYKHLPEIPTAHEIESEGIDLGNNQVLLLKKIEELTLFIINQNKMLEQQQTLIKEMQEQINSQKREVGILKQKIN